MWPLYLVVQKTVTPHLMTILDVLNDAKNHKFTINSDKDMHRMVFELLFIVLNFFKKNEKVAKQN